MVNLKKRFEKLIYLEFRLFDEMTQLERLDFIRDIADRDHLLNVLNSYCELLRCGLISQGTEKTTKRGA